MGKRVLAIATTVLLAANFASAEVELRFTEVQMPLGTTDSVVPLAGNEYLDFGISTVAAYRYHDNRDPFSDGAENQGGNRPYGLSLNSDVVPAQIVFQNPVSNLEVDWWTIIGTLFLDVFDTSDNLIFSFSGSGSGTELINASNIGRLEWQDSTGFVQISNIRFDESAVIPEPTSIAIWSLLASSLFGFACYRECRSRRRVTKV